MNSKDSCPLKVTPLFIQTFKLLVVLTFLGAKVDLKSLSFGAHLSSVGFSDAQLIELAGNPNATLDGKTESVFDMTEEKSHDESAQILKKAYNL